MKKVLQLGGMSCGHCVGHVKSALEDICGVKSVDVNLENQSATVELAHEVEESKFQTAIKEAGYEFISVE